MRRGKLNNTAYILVIISAIFTLMSYICDQLVIRNENNLRVLNYKFDNLDTNIKSLESISTRIDLLEIKMSDIIEHELNQRNFLIKNIIVLESKKDFFKELRKKKLINLKDNAIYNIKVRSKNEMTDLLSNMIEIKYETENLFNQKIFGEIKFFDKDQYLKDLNADKIIEYNLDKFNYFKNWDDISEILDKDSGDLNFTEWQDIRNFRLLLVESFLIQKEKIYNVGEFIDEQIDDKFLDLNILIRQQKEINSLKNYLILSGIITQVLTLLFLLLLFKYLIRKKVL